MQESNLNLIKYENYREQFKRLKKALDSGFFLEAIFIEYNILEDRTESVLVHAEKWDAYIKKRKGHDPTIESKVSYIRTFAREKGTLLHRYFDDTLLDNVLMWKDKRNQLIHALLKQKLSTEYLSTIAWEGYDLTRLFRNRASSFSRAVSKKKDL